MAGVSLDVFKFCSPVQQGKSGMLNSTYWGLVGSMRIHYYGDYMGCIFPYSLLRTTNFNSHMQISKIIYPFSCASTGATFVHQSTHKCKCDVRWIPWLSMNYGVQNFQKSFIFPKGPKYLNREY